MSASKSQILGESKGLLRPNPSQKERAAATLAQKVRHLGISGFLPFDAVSYSDHP